MFVNYFKMAWRNLRQDSLYSIINILGLATATAAFLLMINFVSYEYSYEGFHKKADHIYRVTYDLYQGTKYQMTDCETHPPIASMLKKDFPEVRNTVRVQHMEDESEVNYHHQVYRINYAYAVDPSFFDIFSYRLIKGNKATVLNSPMQVVLTQSQCKRIFGSTDVIGKSIQLGKYPYAVTGVIQDPPLNTHLKVDMLLSFSSLPVLGWDLTSWNGNNNYTYLLLQPGIDLKAFNEKLKSFSLQTLKGKNSEGNRYTAEPIKSIHLYSHKTYEPETNGDAKSVKFMLVSALLILLVGSVNYINLTTARSAKRIKETGLRRLLGSSRALLIMQFLSETLLVNVFAMALAVLIIWIALPFYAELVGRPTKASLFSSPLFWLTACLLLVLNCLLSGFYPAFSLSSTKPIRVVNRVFTASRQSEWLRKALVVGQFATALMVLSASFIVYRQLAYMQRQQLGLNASRTLVLEAPMTGEDSLRAQQTAAMKQALLQLPGVTSVATSGALPGVSQHDISSTTGLSRYGSKEGFGYNFYGYHIDAQFIPTLQIKMAAGENFTDGMPNKNELIINEAAARLLGFSSPAAAVGQKLNWNGVSTIKGVMKDYHQLSMKEAILPMFHYYQEQASFYAVRLQSDDFQQTLAQVQPLWKRYYPGYPLSYHFLNQMFDQQYQNEQRFAKVVNVFSLLTLFITCLGILGLTAYSINQRVREIGIRKVLGASVSSIVQLLSFNFVKLIGIAVVISTPITWHVMNLWLNEFTYHITVQWWVFAVTGAVAIAIALLTLSFQSIRAALMKPVKALKAGDMSG